MSGTVIWGMVEGGGGRSKEKDTPPKGAFTIIENKLVCENNLGLFVLYLTKNILLDLS